MNRLLAQLAEHHGGLVVRDKALVAVPRHVLDRAVRTGDLVRILPETYAADQEALDDHALIRASVAYARAPVAASHLTALALWRLPVPAGPRIHLMTGESRHLRGAVNVLVHRRLGFTCRWPDVVIRQGIPTLRLETSIIDSWPLLDGDAKRAPAIAAIAARLTTPARLREALELAPRLGGRRHLSTLIDRLAAGCRSELEIWGYDHIFTEPSMARFRRQVPVTLASRTIYLDVFDDVSRVNFELDGAKYHTSPRDRERDLRRDSALAARGITVVRLSHARLVHDVDEVRREIAAITRCRRS